MVKKQGVIKIKPTFVFLIIAFVAIGFIALVKLADKQAAKYVRLDYKMKIDTTKIVGNERYGALRGAIFFKKGYFIDTSAKLVENRCNYNKWVTNGPVIDLNSESHEYTLDDLGLPFIVYKKANSDTLNVVKDGCNLKFLIR
ncbi:MAG: hypothetical protein HC896_06060 [Bacteroidales bacterium]|nr:hypothetical protein [Bacteroidales bacterium]